MSIISQDHHYLRHRLFLSQRLVIVEKQKKRFWVYATNLCCLVMLFLLVARDILKPPISIATLN
jgi:hypothetical protein